LEKQGKPGYNDGKDNYAERKLPNGYFLAHVWLCFAFLSTNG
jgi:hypothetical protein